MNALARLSTAHAGATTAVGVLAGGIVGALVAALAPGTMLERVLLGSLALVLIAPLARRVFARRFDLFEPMVVFSVAFGVMFVARPWMELTNGSVVQDAYVPPLYELTEAVDELLLLALIGAIAFYVGYAVPLGRTAGARLRPPVLRVESNAAPLLAVAAGVLGLLLYAAFAVQIGGIGPLLDLIRSRDIAQAEVVRSSTAYLYAGITLVIPAVLILLAVGLERGRRVWLLPAAFFSLVLLVQSGPSGDRMALLMLFGAVVAFAYLRTLRRPRLITVAVAALVVVTLFSVIRAVRYEDYGNERTQDTVVTFVTRPDIAVTRLIESEDAGMAVNLAAQLSVVPEELDYEFGMATVGDLFVRPIPRALWDGKPLPPREEVIQHLWPQGYANGYANPEFSVMATFYRDLGIPAVALGMLAVGLVFRLVYSFLQANWDSRSAQLIYAGTLPFLVIALRDSPADTVRRAVFVLLPLAVIPALAGRLDRRRGTAAVPEPDR